MESIFSKAILRGTLTVKSICNMREYKDWWNTKANKSWQLPILIALPYNYRSKQSVRIKDAN